MKIRQKMTIDGIVQGVGFRPYIHKLVQRNHLTGWICNSNQGVEMEVEGEEIAVDHLMESLKEDYPPLALIRNIKIEKLPIWGYPDFEIKKSKVNHEHSMVLIPPDISICNDCLQELNDPVDRRYRYPFINCTNCGPRFSIIQDMPYDRDKTTMGQFTMCPDCYSEYTDISNRRYHAQPNACSDCGPEVSLYEGEKKFLTNDPIGEAQKRLTQGQIGLIKGLGGFHLACDAGNHSAVLKVREIKKRDEKPFAIMAADSDTIRNFCHLSGYAERYLQSKERPIVLLKKKKNHLLSPDIAPGNAYIGVMLPYTPLHYLLLQKTSLVLVMTSANLSDQPIIYQNQEAFKDFIGQVDFLLIHNRPIYNRCDDSVVKISANRSIFVRRSRGYAPFPIVLSRQSRQVLALGPEEKNTVCFTRDYYAFPSQHLGDLKNQDSFKAYQIAIERLERMFQFQPDLIACDLHPDYLSTVYAQQLSRQKKIPLLKIQHHFAHIASCMAENCLNQKVIGVAFDGTGLGEDGKIWGGEFLVADLKEYQRIGHLKYQPMPGGEKAIRHPWRMAYSYLYSLLGEQVMSSSIIPLIKRRKSQEFQLLAQMMDKKINSPLTSSCGRLFDAVASLIGIRDEVNFEGQAAIALESLCRPQYKEHYSYEIGGSDLKWVIDTSHMFRQIIAAMKEKENIEKIATQFHNTVADFILSMCVKIRDSLNINLVVLSGGVFQNGFLLDQTIKKLKEKDFNVYIHHKVPPNDACISLGQALIANANYELIHPLKKQ